MFRTFLSAFGRLLRARRAAVRPTRRRRLTGIETLEDRSVPSCTSVSGFVYNDANNNGIKDPGEVGLANTPIELRNAAGVAVADTVTDANGFYTFNTDKTLSTAPAVKEVDATFGPAKLDWNDAKTVDQFDPSLGTLNSVEIVDDAAMTSSVKVENVANTPDTMTVSVKGAVTVQGDGIAPINIAFAKDNTTNVAAFDGTIDFAGPSGHDFGDQTMTDSRSVVLDGASHDLSAFVGTGKLNLSAGASGTTALTSGSDGDVRFRTTAAAHVRIIYHYTPTNCLQPGSYTIVETQQPAGYLDGQETAGNVAPLPGTVGTDAIPVTLHDNDNLTNYNFGEILPASVAGFVYFDPDKAGFKNGDAQPIPNTTVTLTGTNDLGAPVTQTQQTGADGSYLFNGLRPGQYAITETQPAGYQQGTNNVGSLGGSVSGDQFLLNVNAGDQGQNYNFGEVLPPPPPPPPPVVPPPPPPPQSQPLTPDLPLTPVSKRLFTGNDWLSWTWM